jgi:GT2 family glycosyltransferase
LCGWSAPGGRLEGEEEQKEEQKEMKSEELKKEGEPSTSRVTGGDEEEVSKETTDSKEAVNRLAQFDSRQILYHQDVDLSLEAISKSIHCLP